MMKNAVPGVYIERYGHLNRGFGDVLRNGDILVSDMGTLIFPDNKLPTTNSDGVLIFPETVSSTLNDDGTLIIQ